MVEALRYCDERVWMMGLDGAVQEFVEAIPEERRAWWSRIFVAAQPVDPTLPQFAYLLLVFLKDGYSVTIPVSEHLLSDPGGVYGHGPQLAARFERSARQRYDLEVAGC